MLLKEEKRILEKCRSDKSYFKEFYTAYSKDVYRFSYALLNDKDNAEEITSEVFLKCYEKITNYEYRDITIKAWFFTVARNAIYTKYKSHKELTTGSDIIEDSPDENSVINNIDPKLESDVQLIMQELPIITREIIILKIWEEYKFKEIADITGKEENAVKKQYYRGLQRIKEILQNKGYDNNYLMLPMLIGSVDMLKNKIPYSLDNITLNKLLEKSIMNPLHIKKNLAVYLSLLGLTATGLCVVAYLYLSGTSSSNRPHTKSNTTTSPVQNTSQTPSTPIVTDIPVTGTATPITNSTNQLVTYTNPEHGYTLTYDSSKYTLNDAANECPNIPPESGGCITTKKGDNVIITNNENKNALYIQYQAIGELIPGVEAGSYSTINFWSKIVSKAQVKCDHKNGYITCGSANGSLWGTRYYTDGDDISLRDKCNNFVSIEITYFSFSGDQYTNNYNIEDDQAFDKILESLTDPVCK